MQDDHGAMRRQTDVMDAARGNAMLAALGLPGRLAEGDALPPFFHQLYFWEAQPPEKLGRDGHPKVGDPIPDMGLPRRMWAGGQLTFHAPLRVGARAQKTSTVAAATRKTGRSGPLAFVTLRHEISQGDALCVTELQDLVYREDPDPAAPRPVPPQAATDEDIAAPATFNPTLLFRYSALTFNGHRIHYDRAYASEVEGYDGLVVHGPLLAQLLLLMAERDAPVRAFSFRATAPLMDVETAMLCRKGGAFWVRGPDGRQCMQAEVQW